MGDWVDGKKHGDGELRLAGGEAYIGKWADDMRHGEGTHSYSDGKPPPTPRAPRRPPPAFAAREGSLGASKRRRQTQKSRRNAKKS